MCSLGGRAELECSVQEEDWQTGQSYMAQWHSLTLIPQHHHRLTVLECSGQHWEARRLLQRFLSGAISRSYTFPKTYSNRRVHQPISDLSAMGLKGPRGPAYVQKEEFCATSRTKSIVETSEKKKTVKFLG